MRIGLLTAGHLPDEMQARTGDYDQLYGRLLEGQGIELVPWDVVNSEFPQSVDAADGWLISGSKHGAYEDHPWIARLEEFIRAAYEARVPIVGICFGHQIVAQALGGRVEKFKGGWAIGRHEYDWNGDKVVLNAWHQDQVVATPLGAEVVARSPHCAYAALVYPGGAFTVQAHPEFDRQEVASLIEVRAPGLVPEPLIQRAEDALDEPVDNQRLAHQIGAFFRETRHG
ncbi:MAG: type 1 glutamine amidotransferase [Pseudomonadota bacterium]